MNKSFIKCGRCGNGKFVWNIETSFYECLHCRTILRTICGFCGSDLDVIFDSDQNFFVCGKCQNQLAKTKSWNAYNIEPFDIDLSTLDKTVESVDKCIQELSHAQVSEGLSNVRKTNYYDIGEIRTIDIIKAKLTPDEFIGFCRGNVIKYITRAGWKERNPLSDLEKARDYLDWTINAIKEEAIDNE